MAIFIYIARVQVCYIMRESVASRAFSATGRARARPRAFGATSNVHTSPSCLSEEARRRNDARATRNAATQKPDHTFDALVAVRNALLKCAAAGDAARNAALRKAEVTTRLEPESRSSVFRRGLKRERMRALRAPWMPPLNEHTHST